MPAAAMRIDTPIRGPLNPSALSPYAEKCLHQIGRRRRWENGQVLLSRGQMAEAVILVLSGRLKVVTVSAHGEEHLLRWLEPGELTGLSSLITETPFPADLIATGTTELLHVDRQRLVSLIQSDGEVAMAIVKVLSMRVSQLIDMIADQAQESLEHKVWAALERLSTHHGTPVKEGILLRVSQSDLAHSVAGSRQRVNLVLQQLQAKGLVELGYRRVVLRRKP